MYLLNVTITIVYRWLFNFSVVAWKGKSKNKNLHTLFGEDSAQIRQKRVRAVSHSQACGKRFKVIYYAAHLPLLAPCSLKPDRLRGLQNRGVCYVW